MPQIPNNELLANLAALTGSADLVGAKLHLATAVANPLGPNSVVGDFTEAAYTGYASVVVTWSAPFLNLAGQAQADSQLIQYQPTDGLVPEVITYWYLTNGAGTKLLLAGQLIPPVSLLSQVDALPVSIQYVFAGPSPP